MIALFVMLIVVIGLVGTLGYTVISFQKSADLAAMTQRNASRMDAVASIIRGNARPLVAGGQIRLPVGENLDEDTNRTVVPVKLVGDNRTPWGGFYGYCPLALPGAGEDINGFADILAGAESYTALTSESAGQRYIVGVEGDVPLLRAIGNMAIPENVLGFIVSPAPNRYEIPYCHEIIYRDGSFVIGTPDTDGDNIPDSAPSVGGTVIPIMGEAPTLRVQSVDKDPVIHIGQPDYPPPSEGNAEEPEAEEPVNDETGRNSANAMQISSAITYWKSTTPQTLTLLLADGTYDISELEMIFKTDMPGRFVRITDNSPDSPRGATLTSDNPVNIEFGVDGAIEGITLDDKIGIKVSHGARVTVAASTVPQIIVDGGDVILEASSEINHSIDKPGSPIDVRWGSLRIVEGDLQVETGDPEPAPRYKTILDHTLVIDSAVPSAPAISVAGGNASLAANLEALESQLPWRVTKTGKLDVVARTNGATPTIAFSGVAAAEIPPRAPGNALPIDPATPNVAAATCSPVRPYVVHASCSADAGALRSSTLTSNGDVQGWSCTWADDSLTVSPGPASAQMSIPAEPLIELECSASPL